MVYFEAEKEKEMKKQLPFNPLLTIVIINYNTGDLVKQLLESISRFDKRLVFSACQLSARRNEEEIVPAEIIVVDNNSTDGSRKLLKELNFKSQIPISKQISNSNFQTSSRHPDFSTKSKSSGSSVDGVPGMVIRHPLKMLKKFQHDNGDGNKQHDVLSRHLTEDAWPLSTQHDIKLKLIFNKTNLGFGRANNQAMKIARGQYILLLNSDTLVKEGAISQTVFWLSSHPEYDVVGCRLLNKDGSRQPSTGHFPTLPNVAKMLFADRLNKGKAMASPSESKPVDWIMGAFMLLRREVFEKSHGFDKHIFMYMEEVEWCYRLKKLGFRVGFYADAKIIHFGGGSSPGNRRQRIWHIYEGLLYFYRRHRSRLARFILRTMLVIKAAAACVLGAIIRNHYLRITYCRALRLSLSK